MALRAGYKGFKKLLPGLKVVRPGVMGVDYGEGLEIDGEGKLSVKGDLINYNPFIKYNTELIYNSIWGDSGKNLNVFPYVKDSYESSGLTVTLNDGIINLDGTATAVGDMLLHYRSDYYLTDNNPIILKAGTYKVIKNLSKVDVELFSTLNGQRHRITILEGDTKKDSFILSEETQIGVYVTFESGTVFDNDELKILLTDVACLDESFELYRDSVKKLFASKSIECDKTAAGTYTLSATVDARGAVTYEWTAVTP